MLVSVVIPTFRRPHLLRQAVQSVLAQTWRPIELVVVDDGSPDDSFAQIQAMSAEVSAADVTPAFSTKPNGGVASARNFGIARASGELVAFLDDDDLFFPTKLEKQVAAMASSGAGASCCQVERRVGDSSRPYPHDPAGLIKGRDPAGVLRRAAWGHTNSLVVRREVLKACGGYDERLQIFEDDEFLIRLAHHADFAPVPEVLATWIDRPDSLSRVPDKAALQRRDHNRRLQADITREACRNLAGWNEPAWQHAVALWYKQIVNHYIWAGDLAGAAENLRQGVARAGWLEPLRRTRRKLWKARLYALVGLRVRDRRRDPIYD
ncbi:MAG: glycosyltransferase family 2 protein [Planctomycetes bacterium]|nr:glycosyltransferase family 2 protein [Planctomycetota bacterium]